MLTSSAAARASTTSGIVVITVNSTVLPNVVHTIGSVRASA